MEKTAKPIIAGVLSIIAGAYTGFFLALMLFVGGGMYGDDFKIMIFWIMALVAVVIGIIAFIAGIFGFLRKRWLFTIIGSGLLVLWGLFSILDALVLEPQSADLLSIMLTVSPAILGAPALILFIFSKKEFHSSAGQKLSTAM